MGRRYERIKALWSRSSGNPLTINHYGFCAILLKTGKVLTFGARGNGQLGYDVADSPHFQKIPRQIDTSTVALTGYNGSNAIAISCGSNFLTVLLSNGEVNSVGDFTFGQLGDVNLVVNIPTSGKNTTIPFADIVNSTSYAICSDT